MMNEEFYRNFLKQLELVDERFYWCQVMDAHLEWTGTYAWGLKGNLYSGENNLISLKEVVESVSKHIQILP